MRVFVAGATGAIGRPLVRMLVDAGHDVVGTTRSTDNVPRLEAAGATAAVMDGLDASSVNSAVALARPDVVIHQLTSLRNIGSLKRFDDDFTETNRLRTVGTDHLVGAAREAGVNRFIAQSFTGWPNPRDGGSVKTEADGLDPHPTKASVRTLNAIRYVEDLVSDLDDMTGIVLRYGGFYGGDTGLSRNGEMLQLVRRRKLPIVGSGQGVWSFVHIDDAARATLLAIDHGEAGVYNIVDGDPAPVSEWLPVLAETIGAKKPMRLPRWIARPLIGEHGISLMTSIRGSSNAKAKRELGWELRYPSWRQGFRDGLG